MNVLVIATHHGAFLTLQQLKQWKYKNVVVVIPQSQIDKYSRYDGAVFKNFEKNIRKFCGKKWQVYVDVDWDAKQKIKEAYAFLKFAGKTGKWLVLESGALLGGRHAHGFPPFNTTYGVTYQRVYPRLTKLYTMLGEPEESKKLCTSSFFVNLDNPAQTVTYLPGEVFHRADTLYEQSFGMLSCIRYQQMVAEAWTVNFWMEAIKPTEASERVAYPFDWYAAYAEPVKKYLPKQTYDAIMKNAELTWWMEELVSLDL